MLRLITLMFGVVSGLAVAQFPEFSQQYLQRLSGAVDALEEVVADFDRSATAEGLSREEALQQMNGNAFVERRQTDMRATFARLERLSAEEARLRGAGALERLIAAPRIADSEIAEAAWAQYQPAVPATLEGLSFGAAGFALGAMALRVFLGLLLLPFRRRNHA
ncbi:DUF2937 family protein [Algicella marina]|nr:DUF2937 family protein [Algicella marina]